MSDPQFVFNPPPNWPPCPAGWTPPSGWQPDPAWPPAPTGWEFWRVADAAPITPGSPSASAPGTAPTEAPTAATPALATGWQPGPAPMCAPPTEDRGSWLARHKLLSGVGGAFLFLMLVTALAG